MNFKVSGIKELNRKLSQINTQLHTTLEIQLTIFLNNQIRVMRTRIDETGPNGPLYKQAKDKVFGSRTPYEVTGSLIDNVQSVKVNSGDSDRLTWSFGVQPIKEDTYSINLIFEMFRTGKRGLGPDIQKLSTEIAEDLEKNYPNFKYFYRYLEEGHADSVKPKLIEEIKEIITKIVQDTFK